MILLDSTVLVYAVGFQHPLREPCRSLIEAIDEGTIRATTTTDVVARFAQIRARRWGGNDAVTLALAYTDLLSPVLTVEQRHLALGLRSFAQQSHLSAADAVLAATASVADAVLVSADPAFADLAQLRHEYPDAAGVARLLSAGSAN